jgi:hypothetical protein
MAVFMNYMYHQDQSYGIKQTWRCINRGFKGRIQTTEGKVSFSTEHYHESNESKNKTKILNSRLKSYVETTNYTIMLF